MDLYTIDKVNYNPLDLIESYDSLLWTERFQEPGDFELKTHVLESTYNALPKGTFVAIRESNEVMVVEDRAIETNEDGEEILTVTGRSLMSFMENRYAGFFYNQINIRGDDPGTFEEVYTYPVSAGADGNPSWNDGDAIKWIIDMHMTYGLFTPGFSGSPSAINPEKVPNFSCENLDTTGRSTAYKENIIRDNLYEAVHVLLLAGDNGFRVVRPFGAETNLKFQIYNGLNRSANQEDRLPIILSKEAGDLLRLRQFDSTKGSRNSFRIYTNYMNPYVNTVWDPNDETVLIAPNRMGWNFRDQLIDADNIKDSLASTRARRLKKEQAKYRAISMISAEISPSSAYIFGKDYNMGDLLTVDAYFGKRFTVRITEYIRSEDGGVYTAYPVISEL